MTLQIAHASELSRDNHLPSPQITGQHAPLPRGPIGAKIKQNQVGYQSWKVLAELLVLQLQEGKLRSNEGKGLKTS